MAVRLTAEAFRAARALLGNTPPEFAARLRCHVESSSGLRPAARSALDKLGVEITGGAGARLRQIEFKGLSDGAADALRTLGVRNTDDFAGLVKRRDFMTTFTSVVSHGVASEIFAWHRDILLCPYGGRGRNTT